MPRQPHFSLFTLHFSLQRWMVGVCLVLATQLGFGQKVGVVLSGGGATAIAHIGFLKALEEEGIPIDYITGSSMGAIVGALYSAGYSVAEMDSMARSPEFQQMSEGVLDEQLQFYFKKRESDAGLITIKYGPGSYISQSLPTNLLNSVLFDYKLMELLSPASAAAGYEFDSLFVPFRCVASDVERKELKVFDRGNLNVAVRASATFPFVLKPIRGGRKLAVRRGVVRQLPKPVDVRGVLARCDFGLQRVGCDRIAHRRRFVLAAREHDPLQKQL